MKIKVEIFKLFTLTLGRFSVVLKSKLLKSFEITLRIKPPLLPIFVSLEQIWTKVGPSAVIMFN